MGRARRVSPATGTGEDRRSPRTSGSLSIAWLIGVMLIGSAARVGTRAGREPDPAVQPTVHGPGGIRAMPNRHAEERDPVAAMSFRRSRSAGERARSLGVAGSCCWPASWEGWACVSSSRGWLYVVAVSGRAEACRC